MDLHSKLRLSFLWVAIFASGCGSSLPRKTAGDHSRSGGLAVSEMTLKDLSGKNLHLAELPFSVVILDFFSINCRSCLKEEVELSALENRLGSGEVKIIPVGVRGRLSEVQNWVQQNGGPRFAIHDRDAELYSRLSTINSLPLIAFINLKANKIEVVEHYLSEEELFEKVRLISEAKTAEGPRQKAPENPPSSVTAPQIPLETVILNVPQICEGECAEGVKAFLKSKAHVKRADINQFTKQVILKIDQESWTTAEILKWFDDLGYPASLEKRGSK